MQKHEVVFLSIPCKKLTQTLIKILHMRPKSIKHLEKNMDNSHDFEFGNDSWI